MYIPVDKYKYKLLKIFAGLAYLSITLNMATLFLFLLGGEALIASYMGLIFMITMILFISLVPLSVGLQVGDSK